MQLFNHYSVLIIGILLSVVVFSAERRRRRWWVVATVVAVYVGAWLALRPVARPVMPGADKSLLLELQSPFCLGCVAMKPAVDGLEKELADKLVVRRVDIQSDEGRQLMEQYRVEFTPTFILFDATGKEQWRGTGKLEAEAVRSACR
jgi:thiol-disulfide isomerase/thioredoxin